jgi:hypothetical protein
MGGRQFPKKKPSKPPVPDNIAKDVVAEVPAMPQRKRHSGRDMAVGAAGAIVEYLAVKYGAYWLAWFGVALLFAAFYEYTKEWLSERDAWLKIGARVSVAAVLLVGGLLLVKVNNEALAAYFHFIYVAEVQDVGGAPSKGSLVLFLVDMHNSGKPSIAENYKLSARFSNGKEVSDIAPTFKKWSMNRADGRNVGSIEHSWLVDKTMTPIPPGGLACGWLLFFLPNVPYVDIEKGKTTTWILSFSDVDADQRKAILRTSMDGKCCEKSPHDDPCIQEQLNWASMKD